MPRKTPQAGVPLASLLPSWQLSLQESNRSPKTVLSYLGTADRLIRYLKDHELPDDTERIDAPHLRAFLLAEAERTSPVSAAVHFRNLRVLFGWLGREGERAGPNPMARVDAPKVSRKVKESLTTAQLAALLKACGGGDFESRRDTAMIRVLIDSGVRVSGLAGMRTEDVNLAARTIKVTLKGGEQILIPLGKKAAAALDRYLRARARHPYADSEWLWLGLRGHHVRHFGVSGIGDMVERRGEQAGIDGLSPHWFRRTFARDWLDAGGSELHLMAITGWRTREMINVYAGDLAAERARDAHARLSPGDRI
jgi:site-specific recombinase XerD